MADRDFLSEIKNLENTINKQDEFIESLSEMNKSQSMIIFRLKEERKKRICFGCRYYGKDGCETTKLCDIKD
jgi:hypothetical protein